MTTKEHEVAPRLTDAQLVEMMGLIKGADSVELKLTIPTDSHRATIAHLELDPIEAQPRQVYFFDTRDLTLDNAGIVVRARRRQGGRGDSVVKLRPVQPEQLPESLRTDPSFNVEVDAMPGGFVCSASFKGRTTAQDVRDAVGGKLRVSKLFSKGQRAFFAERAPAGLDLDALVPLGPTFILKAIFEPKDLPRRFVAEFWLYQDGSRILELSTKCATNEAFQVAADVRNYLTVRGISLSGVQQTKTRTALEFFKARLAEEEKEHSDKEAD